MIPVLLDLQPCSSLCIFFLSSSESPVDLTEDRWAVGHVVEEGTRGLELELGCRSLRVFLICTCPHSSFVSISTKPPRFHLLGSSWIVYLFPPSPHPGMQPPSLLACIVPAITPDTSLHVWCFLDKIARLICYQNQIIVSAAPLETLYWFLLLSVWRSNFLCGPQAR